MPEPIDSRGDQRTEHAAVTGTDQRTLTERVQAATGLRPVLDRAESVWRGRLGEAAARADWDQVFTVAARRKVAVEIDGSWDRQDVHYELAARALAHGCLFALDSDAHSHPEYNFVDIAIAHAKLAGIPQKRIVNYWPDEEILEWARGSWAR